MVKMHNAWTTEIDEPQEAVEEILGQLDLDSILLKNTAGFITTYYEFVESGVVAALCEALPFEVIGGTTLSNGVDGHAGTMSLCLTVLTSDDSEFAAVMTEPLAGDIEQQAKKAFEAAKDRLSETPKFAMTFLPMLREISGEAILEHIDAACPGVSFFGSAVSDHDTSDFSNSVTICNGETAKDRVPFLFFAGDFEPEFRQATVSEKVLQRSKAVITKSEGHRLMEVNDLSMIEYLNSIGLMRGSEVESVHVIPFLLDYNDGSPEVARALLSVDEDGAAICGGKMPQNSTMAIGKSDFNDLLETAGKTVRAALASGKNNGLILVSCAGRHLALGADVTAEFDEVERVVAGALPVHMSYSGGEVCPVYDEKAGRYINRYHNFTFTACIF